MSNGIIGVITNDRHQVFQRDLITGITDYAEGHQFEVVVDSIAENPDHPQPISLDITQLSGVIIITNVLDDVQLADLYETGKPISLISHFTPILPIPAVVQNNTEGINKLVDYLVKDCGRRNLVFIRGDMSQHDGRFRDKVFQQCIYRHNLDIPASHWLRGDFIAGVAEQSMDDLIQSGAQFDGVIAADYLMARAVLGILKSHGLRIPQDVCVVGFGDGPEAEDVGLTTVAADIIDLGRRSTRQLLAQIDGYAMQGVTRLNTAIIERDTCCRSTQ